MNEIKETIAILKARWPEVLLIMGIHLLSAWGNSLSLRVTEMDPLMVLIMTVCALALAVVTALLWVGFLRTVHLEGPKQQFPLDLLRVGKIFFWRTVRVVLLWMPAYFLLAWTVFMVVKQPVSIGPGFWEAAETDPVAFCCSFAMAELILIKFVLLILPIVIVTDCRISTSFRLLRRCRLSDAEGLVVLFVASVSFTVLWAFLPSEESIGATWLRILSILLSLTQRLIGLIVAVMAVRYVGSLGLVREGRATGPDSGNLA